MVATDMLAEPVVGVARKPRFVVGPVVQHDGIDPAGRAGDLAQRLQVKPHDPRNAALVAEEFGGEEEVIHAGHPSGGQMYGNSKRQIPNAKQKPGPKSEFPAWIFS